MKKTAPILMLLGSGLIAFGLTGFNGELSAELSGKARFNGDDGPYKYNGYFQWPIDERLETTLGVSLLVSSFILRKNSN